MGNTGQLDTHSPCFRGLRILVLSPGHAFIITVGHLRQPHIECGQSLGHPGDDASHSLLGAQVNLQGGKKSIPSSLFAPFPVRWGKGTHTCWGIHSIFGKNYFIWQSLSFPINQMGINNPTNFVKHFTATKVRLELSPRQPCTMATGV